MTSATALPTQAPDVPSDRSELILEVVAPDPATTGPGSEFRDLVHSVRESANWTTMAIADRVHSDADPGALDTARQVADELGRFPLVHVTGKGRTAGELTELAAKAARAGVDEALLMTGDRIKDRAREHGGRVPYTDSVNLVELWRQHAPQVRRGAVVNPFKLVEEDLRNQLLKLNLKVGAGADVVTTQIGFSWPVYVEFLRYAARAHPGVPVRASVCYLPMGVARVFAAGSVPGVVLPSSVWARIQRDAADPGARTLYARRVAVQVLTLRALGYNGVQVACLHRPVGAERVAAAIEDLERERLSRDDLCALWEQSVPLDPAVRYPIAHQAETGLASRLERARYRALDAVDHAMFDPDNPVGAQSTAAVRALGARPAGRRLLQVVEDASKRPLVGCQMCGFCRLPHTMYVCPETCPKGLANGPCGGTSDGTCEFGDRPCIHNLKYRTAQAFDRLDQLAHTVIPPVPEPIRGSSSWLNHAQGRDPQLRQVPPAGATPIPLHPAAHGVDQVVRGEPLKDRDSQPILPTTGTTRR